MNTSKWHKFKVSFLSLSAAVFVFVVVKGLFDVDFNNSNELLKLFLKGLITGVVVGALLGVMNMYMDIFPFKPKNK